MQTPDLTHLAHQIAEHGMAAADDALTSVIDRAAAAGVPSVLLAVLADRTQPEAARCRAFGRIAAALSFGSDTGSPSSLPPAPRPAARPRVAAAVRTAAVV